MFKLHIPYGQRDADRKKVPMAQEPEDQRARIEEKKRVAFFLGRVMMLLAVKAGFRVVHLGALVVFSFLVTSD